MLCLGCLDVTRCVKVPLGHGFLWGCVIVGQFGDRYSKIYQMGGAHSPSCVLYIRRARSKKKETKISTSFLEKKKKKA